MSVLWAGKRSMRAPVRLLGIMVALISTRTAIAGPSDPAYVPLPRDVTLSVGDARFRIAAPPGLCAFPAEIRERVGAAMGGEHVIMAAADCAAVSPDGLARHRVARRSTLLTVSDRDWSPVTRMHGSGFLRECFLQFSPPRSGSLADELDSFNKGGFGIFVGSARNDGLLRLTPGVVFGGLRESISADGHNVATSLVTACTTFDGIPVTWVFQEADESGAVIPAPQATSPSLLREALDYVSASARLNPK